MEVAAGVQRDARGWLARQFAEDARLGYVPTDLAEALRKPVALARLALRIEPDQRASLLMLAEAARSLGLYGQAAENQQRYLQTPTGRIDDGAFTDWLRYRLASLDTIEGRQDFLREVSTRPDLSSERSAVVYDNWAALAEGKGDRAVAIELYRRALQAERTNPDAIRNLAVLVQPAPSLQQRVEDGLALLRGNPLAINVAWELGQICRSQGLYDRALTLYDYAYEVSASTGRSASTDFVRDYADAMLDAGQPQRALDTFARRADMKPVDLGLASLMAEAAAALNRPRARAYWVGRMDRHYRTRQALNELDALGMAEMGWFQWLYEGRPLTASRWADNARAMEPNDPFILRVWAMTFLDSDSSDQALEILSLLQRSDPYALATRLDRAMKADPQFDATGMLEHAAAMRRGGPGWRYLRRVFERHGLAVPPRPATADSLDAMIAEQIDAGWFEMGLHPDRFVRAALTMPAETFAPGEPMVLTATLENIGTLPVPLGDWGLVTPRMLLSVGVVVDKGAARATYEAALTWPTPRRLMPGQKLETTVRIDDGPVADLLVSRPLWDVELRVEAILDPVERVRQLRPALSSLAMEPRTVGVGGLLREPDPVAYQQALLDVNARLRGKDAVPAMWAGRTVASLLAMHDEIERGQTASAGKLAPFVRRGPLLEMLRYALQEATPEVRCATLAAMRDVRLTPEIIQLMGPCLAHPSEFVRARAIERLGELGSPALTDVLQSFAEGDADPLVRAMAESYVE